MLIVADLGQLRSSGLSCMQLCITTCITLLLDLLLSVYTQYRCLYALPLYSLERRIPQTFNQKQTRRCSLLLIQKIWSFC
jgi:hypothetical protein